MLAGSLIFIIACLIAVVLSKFSAYFKDDGFVVLSQMTIMAGLVASLMIIS